jgi:hypothetical protein
LSEIAVATAYAQHIRHSSGEIKQSPSSKTSPQPNDSEPEFSNWVDFDDIYQFDEDSDWQ